MKEIVELAVDRFFSSYYLHVVVLKI